MNTETKTAADLAPSIVIAAYDKRIEVLESHLSTALGMLYCKPMNTAEQHKFQEAMDALNAGK